MLIEQSANKDYKILDMPVPSPQVLSLLVESQILDRERGNDVSVEHSLAGQWYVLITELLKQYGSLEMAENAAKQAENHIQLLRSRLDSYTTLQLQDQAVRAERRVLRNQLYAMENQYEALIADIISEYVPYTPDLSTYTFEELLCSRKQDFVNCVLISVAEMQEHLQKEGNLNELQKYTITRHPHETDTISERKGDNLDELANWIIHTVKVDIKTGIAPIEEDEGHTSEPSRNDDFHVLVSEVTKAAPVSLKIISGAADWITRQQLAAIVYPDDPYTKIVENRLNKVIAELCQGRGQKMGYNFEKRKNGRYDEIRFVPINHTTSSDREYETIQSVPHIEVADVSIQDEIGHSDRFVVIENDVVQGISICLDTSSDPLYTGYLVIQRQDGTYDFPIDGIGQRFDIEDIEILRERIYREHGSNDTSLTVIPSDEPDITNYPSYADLSQVNQQAYLVLRDELLNEYKNLSATSQEIEASLNRAIAESNILREFPTWIKTETNQIRQKVRSELLGRSRRDFKLTRGQKEHKSTL